MTMKELREIARQVLAEAMRTNTCGNPTAQVALEVLRIIEMPGDE